MNDNIIDNAPEVMEDEDYKKLSVLDQKIINKINKILQGLSEEGREYWKTYYS